MSFNLISSGKAVFLSLTFLSTFVLSTPAYAIEDVDQAKNAPALTRVKGTKVLMETPDGFTQAPSFNGYVLKEKSASIMVTEMPAPVDKLFEGFTKENLAKKRMELVSREDVEVAGRKGILLHVKQPLASLMFEKWITVFGDKEHAILVMAFGPAMTPH